MGTRAEMMAEMMMRNNHGGNSSGDTGNNSYDAAANPEMMAEMMMRRSNDGSAGGGGNAQYVANNHPGRMMPRPPFDDHPTQSVADGGSGRCLPGEGGEGVAEVCA
eukprot:490969_1